MDQHRVEMRRTGSNVPVVLLDSRRMLQELNVDNIAIIERAQLALGPGFTALTGETGAGKSLLVDAIGLALGERADSELVRTGAARAVVSLSADLTDNPAAVARCRELGVELEDGVLFVQRELSAEGRSTCRLGGRVTPVGTLREIGDLLVDLHGQHDHQSLLNPETHLGFLDGWIGAQQELGRVQEAYAQAARLRVLLGEITAGRRDREHKLDLLRFQVNEIEAVDPKPGETEETESLVRRLQNVTRLAEGVFSALGALEDDEDSASVRLGNAVRSLEALLASDPALEAPLEPLRTALYALQDAGHQMRAYADALDSDPMALERAAERLDSLRRLQRKYGDTDEAVLSFLIEAKAQLARIEDAGESEQETRSKLDQAEARLREEAAALSKIRRAKAVEFAALVQSELRELAMERALFEVNLRPKEPEADGADQVEFFFSANAGEPPKPLSKIASGGEISRVMLAIKVALAGRAGVPTLIFDEVDSGLGGRAAAVVGKKLEQLARHYQVVAITHLPQIAGRATTHFRIEKVDVDGRSVTTLRHLGTDERVEEIARMLGGEEIGESALANARELLA